MEGSTYGWIDISWNSMFIDLLKPVCEPTIPANNW